ncbi:MAG: hypothetical protein ACTHL1_04585 [Burkholderiaceae bacterium]
MVTGCACAFGMSTHAHRRKRPEFRWFLAGILFGVLALPVYFLAARRADRAPVEPAAAASAASASSASSAPSVMPADVEPPRYAAAADAFLMPGRGAPRSVDEIGKINALPVVDPQRDPIA